MEGKGIATLTHRVFVSLFSLVALTCILGVSPAFADFNLTVADQNGAPVASYKWLLEEDTTFDVTPGTQVKESLWNSFHGSYSPVATSGESLAGQPVTIPTDPLKKYHISVTATGGTDGYTMNGVQVARGTTTPVTVTVHTLPLPTALISILIFPDFFKVNGVYDLPQEVPNIPGSATFDPAVPVFDPTKFTVQLYEAGGRTGMVGGLVSQDAFGNPLGTTYDAAGNAIPGSGVGTLTPGPDGRLIIRNLVAAKYGIQVVPPAGQGWQQTSTLEGGKTIDAWVQANEAPWFTEFGPPGQHVFIGFVQPTDKYSDGSIAPGTNVISGTVVNNHMQAPPLVAFFDGHPFPGCWIALQPAGAVGGAEYIQPCDANSSFSINNVPDGSYELTVFDKNQDILLATTLVSVGPAYAANSGVLGNVGVFDWFARLEATVFNDVNENGFRDPGELPLQEQGINIRFRDGTVYQSYPTDTTGVAPFDEVFPFFHWLVAEVGYTTLKATGVTYVVDGGGGDVSTGAVPVDNGWVMPSLDKLNPQDQFIMNPITGNNLSTTLTGPILTLGMQTFLGQTSTMDFGKAAYGPGENGGISGIVFYAVTRAENDPRLAAGEPWEPGIARVPVTLYADGGPAGIGAPDGIIDDLDNSGTVTLADVDFAPFGNFPGPEDTDNNLNGVFDYGDAVQVTSTDSWDDNQPTGCVPTIDASGLRAPFIAHPGTVIEKTTDCYDGFRIFNQVRPAVFDGGYAFSSAIVRDGGVTGAPVIDVATGAPVETAALAIGGYIVQTHMPAGYKTIKEEDRNVDFGDSYTPDITPLLTAPICVGAPHQIPQFMSFQTDASGALLAGITAPITAPFYIDSLTPVIRPLCDMKQVFLTGGQNAAADFFMFTDVPPAAHVTGTALDDLSNEFDPLSPNFGEKFGMKWVPVTFRDWTGRQIAKTYTDEYGRYNALVPSTYTVNVPSPSGVSPNIMSTCINDGAPDPVTLAVDVNYKANYSTTCYSMNFMPGATSYLDTPVVPIAAFAGANQFPADCEIQTREPEIKSVTGPTIYSGPYAPEVATAGSLDAVRTIVINSSGVVDVPNPNYDGTNATLAVIPRDYGFGVTPGSAMLGSTPLTIASWSDASITAVIPVGTPTGELSVTRSNGKGTRVGVTVTTTPQNVIAVSPSGNLNGKDIQTAIDSAPEGSLILIAPGDYYEMLIMDRPLKLQGFGARSTVVSALRVPSNKLTDWRVKVKGLITAVPSTVSTVPGQVVNVDPLAGPLDPYAFQSDEAPVVLVMAHSAGTWATTHNDSRIDGLTLKSGDQGGAVLVNGYAHNLSVSNNRITGNQGNFGGGVRFGNALYASSPQSNVSVHNNHIAQNGGATGSGGGISIHGGTDNYSITENFICGNFTSGSGAGIGHQGLSNNGLIADNTIVYNQSFSQGLYPDGGGIYIDGIAPIAGLGEGSGSVSILRNHIEGNQAGSGLGGGIRLININGADISTGNPYAINIENNMIVDNVAGNAGGGIAIKDAVAVTITNNTIAHNMSTSTSGLNFQLGIKTQSFIQDGAGITSAAHTAGVAAAIAAAGQPQTFADPALVNNILWQNRSFNWLADTGAGAAGLEPVAVPHYSDLNVQGGGVMHPMNGILTDATGYDVSNTTGDPLFINGYENGGRDVGLILTGTVIGTAPALDEGGNFIDVRYGPLSLVRNYHILTTSPAVDTGVAVANANDIDGLSTRPVGAGIDKGADEVSAAGDTDLDGVTNDMDNCINVANTNQRDSNLDGFGNMCDADFNNNGIVNLSDYSIFRAAFGTANADVDFNGDGIVNLSDYSRFRASFGGAPGPSAVAP